MISFVWSSKYPFLAGAGGSENYTAGQVRELMRRGISTRIITIGHGQNDGRDDFPDISFTALKSKEKLAELDDTLVFVTYPLDVQTKKKSYAILHCPPPEFAHHDPLYNPAAFKGKKIIATSKFAAKLWQNYLGAPAKKIDVVYPFAEDIFNQIERPSHTANKKPKVLFAGRLTPDKGIFTFLASLHMKSLYDADLDFTVTSAGSHSGNHKDEGKIIRDMLKVNPFITVIPARRNSQAMAELMAKHDIVIMPSTNIFWKETFGIVSIEAQHAGCRVIASRSGGLPETNCGGLTLVKPDDPQALADHIAKAAAHGPLTAAERAFAARKFTVKESVDTLLTVIYATSAQKKSSLRRDVTLLPRLQPQLSMFGGRLRESAFPRQRPVGR